jgi:DNA-directed RNA polymerase specialized sigma24 family protein
MSIGVNRTVNREDKLEGGYVSPVSEVSDDALFAQLYPRLRRFAAVVSSLHDDPDDLVQEAVAQALRRGPLHELTNPLAYLRTTICNLNLNHARSRTRLEKTVVRVGGAEHEQRTPAYPSDLGDLMQLSPVDRAIVYCSAVEKIPYRDIAKLVSLSERATAKRAERALAHLRLALHNEEANG